MLRHPSHVETELVGDGEELLRVAVGGGQVPPALDVGKEAEPETRLAATARETTPAERTTLSACGRRVPGLLGACLTVFFKEMGNRHDPRVIIRQLVFFIGRM